MFREHQGSKHGQVLRLSFRTRESGEGRGGRNSLKESSTQSEAETPAAGAEVARCEAA